MHTILALTMMHDRHLASTPPPPLSQTELYHRYQGTSLFIGKLPSGSRLTSSERDALWLASVLLGATTIGNVEAATPQDAWPLKTPSPDDLDWIRMSEGKKVVWEMADLSRPDSCLRMFSILAHHEMEFPDPKPKLFASLPHELVDFVSRQGDPTQADSPYRTAMMILNRLWHLKCDHSSIILYFNFLLRMETGFKSLLHVKDPAALVVLAYWYARICEYYYGWFIWRRAVLECQAICLYLEKLYPDLPNLEKILEVPKKASGLMSA